MDTKAGKMGMGAAQGAATGGIPGAVFGAVKSVHPDSAMSRALSFYDAGNSVLGSAPPAGLEGSANLQQPALGDSENVGNQQQFGLSAMSRKLSKFNLGRG